MSTAAQAELLESPEAEVAGGCEPLGTELRFSASGA